MVRDLSLVVLLVTPATPLLATMTYGYASEGFTQHANAITCVIAVISVTATLLARRLTRAQPIGKRPGPLSAARSSPSRRPEPIGAPS
jgi:iron(III) transport system permease protein